MRAFFHLSPDLFPVDQRPPRARTPGIIYQEPGGIVGPTYKSEAHRHNREIASNRIP